MGAGRTHFFEGAQTRDMVLGWGIIGVPLVALLVLGLMFLRPQPISRESVVGCYVASDAPQLRVELDGIYMLGQGQDQGPLTYRAEPYKDGYHFAVRPAFNLRPTNDGKYTFVRERGLGYFWTMLPIGTAAEMRAPEDYSGRFTIIASNGATVTYQRVGSASRCT